MSPVRRERESNRELPNIFGYVNNHLCKSTLAVNDGKSWYEVNQIKKFGWWLGDKKQKAHQELNELMGGPAPKLLKLFNRIDSIFTIGFLLFS